MRSRSTLFVFALLLLSTSLVSAAPAATSSTSSPASVACNPAFAELGIPVEPLASAQFATMQICGACSVTVCRGVTYNSICQGGTNVKHCIAAYGNSCTDGTWQCQCWSGPLP
jgi:hypothetical protein